VKRRATYEKTRRQADLEAYRAQVRQGAPCPACGALRNVRCDGNRQRNHVERQELYNRWCNEQSEAERLDRMLGRVRRG
jgi:hypothetical protein